ncbi:MAG: chemotaxis protein CheW [Pseudomonadales bacterium]
MQDSTNLADQAAADPASQYLTFVLDTEEYAIDILRVQEIKSWSPVTPVPRAPDHLLGVINLRGAIVPVIDLRRRFHLEETTFTNKTAVIIVRSSHDQAEKVIGLVVDAVAEVYNFSATQIQSSANIGSSVDVDFVLGLAKADEKLVIVLNLEKIVDTNFEPDDALEVVASE